MPAELALHRLGNLVRLELERGVREFRHHPVLREPAEIAALGAGVLRHLGRDLGEILAVLQPLQNLFRVRLGLDEDMAGVNLGFRLLELCDLVIGLLDRGVGGGLGGHLAQQRLHHQLLAIIGDFLREIGRLVHLVGQRLLGDQLAVDQIVEDVIVAGGPLELRRQTRPDILLGDRDVVVRDLSAIHRGQHLRARARRQGQQEGEGESAGARAPVGEHGGHQISPGYSRDSGSGRPLRENSGVTVPEGSGSHAAARFH